VAYAVNLTLRAQRDLVLLFEAISVEDSDAALKWYIGLKEAILSLEEQPHRCPETPEHARLRHLLYGHKPHIYRVIYRVTEKSKQVDVLHIRHGARQGFKRQDLK
jgi:plasmid stabilization system protein ParE